MTGNQSTYAQDEFTRFAFELFFHSMFFSQNETEPSKDKDMAKIENSGEGTPFKSDMAGYRTALRQQPFESAV
jgi:hypothetical protein